MKEGKTMKKVTMRSLQKEYKELIGKEIEIEGWIRTNRDQKQFGFIQFTDGTFFTPIQIVYDTELPNFDEVAKLNVASSLVVRGIVVEPENAKQAFEIKATNIEIITSCGPEYPLQPKRHSREFLREIAHLRPRTNLFQAVFRVRSLAAMAVHEFFQQQDFVYVNTPILTASDGEGAGEMFTVTTLFNKDDKELELVDGKIDTSKDFFGKTASLAVTGQLEGETFAYAFKNIYTFGPTFRAENSHTARHAAEFWMIEPEMAFAHLDVNMEVAQAMVKYIVRYVLDKAPEEMAFFNDFVDKGLRERLDALLESEFPQVTYTEAIDILLKSDKKFENPVSWGIDLSSEHEKYLTDEVYKGPIFLIDYPAEIKAFYMKGNEDGKTVAAMDMLVPGIGELIGGSEREYEEDKLVAKMEKMNVPQDDLWWYIENNRYGGVPHSGYGMGFERMIMYLTGIENIRDVLPYPRTPKNLEF